MMKQLQAFLPVMMSITLIVTAFAGCKNDVNAPNANNTSSPTVTNGSDQPSEFEIDWSDIENGTFNETQTPTSSESADVDPTGEERDECEDYYGTWFCSDKAGIYLIIKEDGTAFYSEPRNEEDEKSLGSECEWTADKKGLHFDFMFDPEHLFLTANMKNDDLSVSAGKTWSYEKKVFSRVDETEEDVRRLIESIIDERNGIVSVLEDGLYHSGQDHSWDEHYGVYFTNAYVDDTHLHVLGFLGTYDDEWNEHYVNNERAEFKLRLSNDFSVWSTGGETEGVEMERDYLNRCFYYDWTGLGLSIRIENGLVTRAEVSS